MQRYGREKAFWHYNRYITPVKAAPGAERNFKKSFLGVKNGKIWGGKTGRKKGQPNGVSIYREFQQAGMKETARRQGGGDWLKRRLGFGSQFNVWQAKAMTAVDYKGSRSCRLKMPYVIIAMVLKYRITSYTSSVETRIFLC